MEIIFDSTLCPNIMIFHKQPKNVALLSVVKDEAPYLLEWVAYHKMLGFDMIIADNGGRDDTSRILSALHKTGIITRLDFIWKKSCVQMPAYRCLLRSAKKLGYKYAGFLDGDEFFTKSFPLKQLTPEEGSLHITRTMDRLKATQISFHWICFGGKTNSQDNSLPCLERFSYHAAKDAEFNVFVKSFIRVDSMFGFRSFLTLGPPVCDPHTHFTNNKLCFVENRQVHSWSPDWPVSYETGAVLHYIVKTREEYEVKSRRGDVIFQENKYGDEYYNKHDYQDTYTPVPADLIENLKKEIKNLENKIRPIMRKENTRLSGVCEWRTKWRSIGTTSYSQCERVDQLFFPWLSRQIGKVIPFSKKR